MRAYAIVLLLFLVGCAATEPEGSVALKHPGKRFMILRQVDGMNFQGCTDVVINSNAPGFQVDAKVVDRGLIKLGEGGEWRVGLATSGEGAYYDGEQSRLTLDAEHPNGPGRPLKVCVQVTHIPQEALEYSNLTPARVADLYITILPPMNP